MKEKIKMRKKSKTLKRQTVTGASTTPGGRSSSTSEGAAVVASIDESSGRSIEDDRPCVADHLTTRIGARATRKKSKGGGQQKAELRRPVEAAVRTNYEDLDEDSDVGERVVQGSTEGTIKMLLHDESAASTARGARCRSPSAPATKIEVTSCSKGTTSTIIKKKKRRKLDTTISSVSSTAPPSVQDRPVALAALEADEEMLMQNTRTTKKKRRKAAKQGVTPTSSKDSADENIPSEASPAKLQKDADELQTDGLLPVVRHREEILRAYNNTDVLILQSATGSGKTTQVPQFLARAVERKILCTQPRRVAATSVAARVADEMHTTLGHGAVGYRVRFQDYSAPNNKVLFLTDGMAVREAVQDRAFLDYSCVILDEAHERSVQTDILMGLVKEALRIRKQKAAATRTESSTSTEGQVNLNLEGGAPGGPKLLPSQRNVPPLKVIVMSATLNVATFRGFFQDEFKTEVLKIDGRQHPVKLYYTPAPADDYMLACATAILQLHKTKPAFGDILCFLPGQEAIESLCQLLEERRRMEQSTSNEAAAGASSGTAKNENGEEEFLGERREDAVVGRTDIDSRLLARARSAKNNNANGKVAADAARRSADIANDEVKILDQDAAPVAAQDADTDVLEDHAEKTTGAEDADMISSPLSDELDDENLVTENNRQETQSLDPDLLICPLYAALPFDQQMSVFTPAPPNARKVVLATNIAETSITIPGIRYVVDSGYVKLKIAHPTTGVECLKVVETSKAQADQRSGRAGREAPGECYRIYPEACFQKFAAQTPPEILRTEFSQLFLLLKSLGVAQVDKFPFLDVPPKQHMIKACFFLKRIGALNKKLELTELGHKLARLPLHPLFGLVLLESVAFECTAEVLSIVAMLSIDAHFYLNITDDKRKKELRDTLLHPSGDHLSLLNVYRKWRKAATYHHQKAFCHNYGLNFFALQRADKVREQLKELLEHSLHVRQIGSCGAELDVVRKCFLKANFTHTAMLTSKTTGEYCTATERQHARVHPTSVLFQAKPPPEVVLFTELVTTTKTYMRTVMAIEPRWLMEVCGGQFLKIEDQEQGGRGSQPR
ncbi:unnamed protein product [Amoebophrya sp. A120]|nr:unnamed protein product [Amoebophrya sp. A120]|eukprot:GSA120T00019036001.1